MPPTTPLPNPTRLGIIGLSASNPKGWAALAHLPYLLSAAGHQKFIVTALCNSSVTAAEDAVRHFSLPAQVRTYGSPADLAADPDVDMVLCCVRTDRHAELIRPAVEAGKVCFVEWPLGRSLAEARELTELARSKGVRTVVGLEDRFNPVVRTVGRLLRDGAIGGVVASGLDVMGYSLGARVPNQHAYTLDRATGTNMISVHLAHTLDAIASVLGPLDLTTLSPALSRSIDTATVTTDDGAHDLRTVPKTTYDNVSMHARLADHGPAVLSVRHRARKARDGESALTWRVEGVMGEVVVTAPMILGIEMGVSRILVHEFATGEVREVEWQGGDEMGALPGLARNMARLYGALGGEDVGPGVVDWEGALALHEVVDAIYGMNVVGDGSQPKKG